MAMRWHDLAFLHWPVSPAALRPHIPSKLALDTFEGEAYLGLVPFYMTGVRPRLVPPIPGLSAFVEMNLRTYVTAEDKPGVWFFSLDATSRFAVRAARRVFHLPYFDARMATGWKDGFVQYRSERVHPGAEEARLAGRYRGTGPAKGTSLERWLTERYCLYSAKGSRVFRGEIHHPRWPLENAEAEIEALDVTRFLGMELSRKPPLVHFAKRLEVVGWLLHEVQRS
jgi:uncharacterized protein YqjF (DUF2071 family)